MAGKTESTGVDEKKAQEEFYDLNSGFEETILELKTESAFDGFRSEFEKLHFALKKSHESEERLIKKTKDLLREINAHAEAVQQAKDEEIRSNELKITLQRETAENWKNVEDFRKREQTKKVEVASLTTEIESLETQLQSGSGWSDEQERAVSQLRRQREDVSRDVDSQMTVLDNIRTVVAELAQRVQDEETKKQDLEQDITATVEQSRQKKLEANRELRLKDVS